MNLSKGIKESLNDINRNKTTGAFAWILHRLTGIALTFYIFLHIFVLSGILYNTNTFDKRMEFLNQPLFHFLELFLIMIILLHLLNGIRITIADFFIATRNQRVMFWICVFLFIVSCIVTVLILY